MEINIEQETIYNPVTSEKLLVLESTPEVFRMVFSINPQSKIAAEHSHPFQEQTITVTMGELHCRVEDKTYVLRAGDSVRIPTGARHFQWNPTAYETRAIEEYRPAGRIHAFFRVLFTLAQEGKTNRKGIPKPLIGAALTEEFKDTVRASSLGLRLLFASLAPLSRLLGYQKMIQEYVGRFEKTNQLITDVNAIPMPIEPF